PACIDDPAKVRVADGRLANCDRDGEQRRQRRQQGADPELSPAPGAIVPDRRRDMPPKAPPAIQETEQARRRSAARTGPARSHKDIAETDARARALCFASEVARHGAPASVIRLDDQPGPGPNGIAPGGFVG